MDQERYEYLEKYLLGELTPTESDTLTKRLATDMELSNDLESVKSLINAAKSKGLEHELESIHQELYAKKQKETKSISWVYVSGAAAVIILLILFLFNGFNQQPGTDKLFNQYFTPFPNYVSLRSETSPKEWQKGFEHYSLGKFDLAIKYFKSSEVPVEREEDVAFYLALSNLSIENTKEAIIIFSELLQEGTKYEQQIHWYLALAYLQSGEIQKTKDSLQKIEEGQFEYNRALELLNLLNTNR